MTEAVAGTTSDQDVSALRFVEAMVAFAEGDLPAARRLARDSRDAYGGTDSVLAGDLLAHLSAFMRDGGELDADRAWLGERFAYGARLERSMRVHEASAFALEGRQGEAAQAYRRVSDELRAADLRLDLALALVQRAWLLGPGDEEAAGGLEEAREVLAAMGADGFLDRLAAGVGPVGGPRPVASSEVAVPRTAPAVPNR